MTLDQLQRRDARIAELETLGRARSRDQDHELARLLNGRDAFWRRLPARIERDRRHLARLDAYARQLGFILDPA